MSHGNQLSRSKPVILGALCLGLCLAVSTPARAQGTFLGAEPLLPGPDTGLVSLLLGVRYVPQGPLLSSANKAGWLLTERTLVNPAVTIPFSYRLDRDWSIGIEFGWSPDSYEFEERSTGAAADFSAQTFGLLISGQWHPNLGWERVEPYLGAGLGYYLTSVTATGGMGELPRAFEAHTGGGYLALGLRVGLGAGWSLLVEERYAFAMAGLADFGAVTVGGNTVSLGISRVWR